MDAGGTCGLERCPAGAAWGNGTAAGDGEAGYAFDGCDWSYALNVCLNHRLAIFAALLVGANLLWQHVRRAVSCSESKHPALMMLRSLPLLRLSEPPPTSARDLMVMTGMYAFVVSFYSFACNPDGRPDAKGPGALPVIRYRLEYNLVAMIMMTALYEAARCALRRHVRDAETLEQQSANVVRILVKCCWMVYLMIYGNWRHIIATDASELREADLEATYYGYWWMCSLYTWELCYRQLLPVSFIHHGAALMAGWSIQEFFGNDASEMAIKKLAPCGLVMSFTEGWCCLILLIGALKGCSLREWSWVMMGNAVVGGIAYNLIALWWIGTVWESHHHMSSFHGNISAPLILLLTYPAQMFMINMFRNMSYSLARQAAEAADGKGGCCDDPFSAGGGGAAR